MEIKKPFQETFHLAFDGDEKQKKVGQVSLQSIKHKFSNESGKIKRTISGK